VQGVIWGINSFGMFFSSILKKYYVADGLAWHLSDQMGVELGKVLAKNILAQLEKPEDVKGHDSSVWISSLFEYPF
jgi:glucose-6-phosphate isomerase